MTSTRDKGQGLETFFNLVLIGASAAWLCNVVVAQILSETAAEGVLFWPILIGLALAGGSLAERVVSVPIVTALLIMGTALFVGLSLQYASALIGVVFIGFLARGAAESAVEEELTELRKRADFLSREVRRLEATRRTFLEKSAKVRVGRTSGRRTGRRQGISEQRAVYRFQRNLLAAMLDARRKEGLAACYRRTLSDCGVKNGLVLVGSPAGFELAAAWGVDDGVRAAKALLSVNGRSFIDWLDEKRTILVRRELASHPMLEEARQAFISRFFMPSLIVPGYCEETLTLVVVCGEQDRDGTPALRPTLFSPLLGVQEEVLKLLLV